MSETKPWPYVTVWGIRGGPSGNAPWVRRATDADLERMNIDKSELGEMPETPGYWAW